MYSDEYRFCTGVYLEVNEAMDMLHIVLLRIIVQNAASLCLLLLTSASAAPSGCRYAQRKGRIRL